MEENALRVLSRPYQTDYYPSPKKQHIAYGLIIVSGDRSFMPPEWELRRVNLDVGVSLQDGQKLVIQGLVFVRLGTNSPFVGGGALVSDRCHQWISSRR